MGDGNEKKEVLKVDMGAEGVKSVKLEFPSNSHKMREERKEEKKEETKKVKKVVTGVVVQKKKSLGKKFMETFVGEDISSVGSYILYDVLIPAAKSTITEMIQSLPELLFYNGEKRGYRATKRDSGRSYVSYNNYSSRDRDRDRRDYRRTISDRNRALHNFDEIVLESRADADDVLDHLADLISEYGQATVADLYDLVGITGSFTDNRYGWTEIGGSSSSRLRSGGYVLNLPRPILLE